ncbi:SDR family oxidoreductase [Plantactinospora sp. B6F1]|uniref:SDR family oxidoreductase n=1 Tax=Plantactinospora sp. B6F1 TaxID=3158971 RepID=UPI0032D8FC18
MTGGSSGIGAATARRLLREGYRVTVTGRDRDRLARFAVALDEPAELLTVVADAAEYDAVVAAVDTTVGAFGRLDVAIANAGFGTHDTVADGNPAGWRDMVLTNVLGPALLIRATVAHPPRASRGRIILVGSVAGVVHTPGNIYGATKWAVTGLAENTRRMVTADGVGLTLIAPGVVHTDFWQPASGVPGRPSLTADQIAEAIAWTVSQPAGVDVNTVTLRPVGQAVRTAPASLAVR